MRIVCLCLFLLFTSSLWAKDIKLEIEDMTASVNSRYTVTDKISPWYLFHNLLANRDSSRIVVNNESIPTIQWLSVYDPVYNGIKIYADSNKFSNSGRDTALEGHKGQFSAILSEINIPLSHELIANGKISNFGEFIDRLKKNIGNTRELTWVLWALYKHTGYDEMWESSDGRMWDMSKIVSIECEEPIVGAACGGNHRLSVLYKARKHYGLDGGVWLVIDSKIDSHIKLAKRLQNRDGSFSSKFYLGGERSNDTIMRINATGHIFEFLAEALPDDMLKQPWVMAAARSLIEDLKKDVNFAKAGGPIYHALNGLIIYRRRLMNDML